MRGGTWLVFSIYRSPPQVMSEIGIATIVHHSEVLEFEFDVAKENSCVVSLGEGIVNVFHLQEGC